VSNREWLPPRPEPTALDKAIDEALVAGAGRQQIRTALGWAELEIAELRRRAAIHEDAWRLAEAEAQRHARARYDGEEQAEQEIETLQQYNTHLEGYALARGRRIEELVAALANLVGAVERATAPEQLNWAMQIARTALDGTLTTAPATGLPCPRCGRPLDTLRGVVVVTALADTAQQVCATCVQPGDMIIAAAK
jgi:hypothetical protein